MWYGADILHIVKNWACQAGSCQSSFAEPRTVAALNMTRAFGMVASKRSMSFSELCNRENADTNEEMSFFIYISNTRSVMVVKTELPDFHPQ